MDRIMEIALQTAREKKAFSDAVEQVFLEEKRSLNRKDIVIGLEKHGFKMVQDSNPLLSKEYNAHSLANLLNDMIREKKAFICVSEINPFEEFRILTAKQLLLLLEASKKFSPK